MSGFPILIPTLGRPDKQETLKSVPHDLLPDTYLVVGDAEYTALKSIYERVIVCPIPFGIAPKRQWICEQFPNDTVLMLDDDLFFRTRIDRVNPENTRLRPATESDIYEALTEIVGIASSPSEYCPIAGMSSAFGNNNLVDAGFRKYDCRVNALYALNVPVLNTIPDCRFSDMTLMSDYYVDLRCITNGYRTSMLTWIAWDQKGGSNAEGGCAEWRTPALQKEQALKLAGHFPDFVKVNKKKSKTAGTWFGDEDRYNVTLYMKKAAAAAEWMLNARKRGRVIAS